eukprot:g39213.t1
MSLNWYSRCSCSNGNIRSAASTCTICHTPGIINISSASIIFICSSIRNVRSICSTSDLQHVLQASVTHQHQHHHQQQQLQQLQHQICSVYL